MDAPTGEEEVIEEFSENNNTTEKGGFTKKYVEPELSHCRDLIFLSGGPDSYIRDLSEKFPDVCFRYQDQERMLTSEFDAVSTIISSSKNGEETEGGQRRRRVAAGSAIPIFHAHLSYVVSPVELYAQPKCLDAPRLRLEEQMNEFYSDADEPLTDEQLFTGVPCVVRSSRGSHWCRSRVTAIPKHRDSVQLMNVDRGERMFLDDMGAVKPLQMRFARLPPLALRCRIKGVDINDLEWKKLEAFDELMEEIQHLARIHLLSTTEPYLVQLLHPTVDNLDIGAPWLPRNIQMPTPSALLPEAEEDFDSSEEEEKLPYIATLSRMIRPPNVGLIPLTVIHVENARSIYVVESDREKELDKLEIRLQEYYRDSGESLEQIPTEHITPETACAVLDPSRNQWIRGIVRRTDESGVVVQSYDRGYLLPRIPNHRVNSIKPLLVQFSRPTELWEARLMEVCAEVPIPSETRILKDLLPVGTKCMGEFERKRGPPWKVDLKFGEATESVLEAFEEEKKKRFVSRSTAVVIHKNPSSQPPPVTREMLEFLLPNHTHRKGICQFTKFEVFNDENSEINE